MITLLNKIINIDAYLDTLPKTMKNKKQDKSKNTQKMVLQTGNVSVKVDSTKLVFNEPKKTSPEKKNSPPKKKSPKKNSPNKNSPKEGKVEDDDFFLELETETKKYKHNLNNIQQKDIDDLIGSIYKSKQFSALLDDCIKLTLDNNSSIYKFLLVKKDISDYFVSYFMIFN
jgi:hypothetical protein